MMSSSSSVQFSYNGVSTVRSILLLTIKCPQLSKPEATVVRNPNSHQVTDWRKQTFLNLHLVSE